MPLCPNCLEAVSDALTCACGWQATIPVTPSMDESALRALVRDEARKLMAEYLEASRPRSVPSSGYGAYRAFGVGKR